MTDYERDQQLRREAAELKKKDLNPENRPVNREYEEKDIPEAEKYKTDRPMTFKEKWNNYWYHYKFWTWAGVFVLVVGLVIVVQLLTKTDYDTRIVLSTTDNLAESQSAYEDAFNQYGVDINGNGSVDIGSVYIQVTTNYIDGMYEVAANMTISLQLSNSENTLYLLDEGVYQYILYGNSAGAEDEAGAEAADDFFLDLESIYPDDPNVDGDRYYIDGTAFAETLGEENISGKYFFCIRNRVGDDEYYDGTLEILENIINGTKTVTE